MTPPVRANPIRPMPSAVALAVALAWPAWAQERTELETIIITAEKRLMPLQDVPVAVKAFSAKQIQDAGIKTTQDFIGLVPNVGFENSFTYGNSFVSIRGVNQINNGDSPVAVVVDGVPQANQKQLKMNLFDVQRIEVLKGPQGALYGRNAIGGAIVIETKAPSNTPEGFAGIGLGKGNYREVNAGVTGAIVADKVLFRLAGQALKSDGLITNTFLNKKADYIDHDNSLRGKLLIRASNTLQVDLRASVNDFSAGAIWDGIVRDSGPDTITSPRSNLLGNTKGRTSELSAKFDWDTPIGVVTAITGFTRLTEDNRGDLDFSNPSDPGVGVLGDPVDFGLPPGTQFGQGQNLKVRMLSQEVRITSPDGKPVRWIAGAYLLRTYRDLDTRGFIDSNGELSQFDDPNQIDFQEYESNRNTASAVFGQIEVDMNAQTTLAGALRYDRDARRQTDKLSGDKRAANFSDWQPKVTLTHRFDKNRLGYLTYSTGFRSGGFNAPGKGDFKPETLDNFEAGLKSTLIERRLYLNAAVFVAQSKNYQFFRLDTDQSQIIENIDKVRMRGLDLDWSWLVMRGLVVDGGLGVTLSKIRKNSAEAGTEGNYTPNATPWKLTLGAQVERPVASGVKGIVRADIEHRSKKYWDPDNVATTRAQTLVSLRAGVSAADDRWSVSVSGSNLTNERYYSDYGSAKYFGSPPGVDTGSLAPPRTFGLDAQFKF
jgi:iron complex outermembrane recepter protein